VSAESIPQKQCSLCKQIFPATTINFHRDKKGKYGLGSICKDCKRNKGGHRKMPRPDPITGLKECTSCHKQLPFTVEYFVARRTVKSGLHSICKECAATQKLEWVAHNRQRVNTQNREYRLRHPEKDVERSKNWARNNPDKAKANKQRYILRHPAKVRQSKQNWERNNPDKKLANTRNRRARLKGATGKHTAEDVAKQFASQKGCCWHCGLPINGTFHVDHLIPVSRGGSNDARNIVISCPSCNLSKSDKLPHEWNGRLL
jgi:5-methylcytosine-specific restriction endonuclease McrA